MEDVEKTEMHSLLHIYFNPSEALQYLQQKIPVKKHVHPEMSDGMKQDLKDFKEYVKRCHDDGKYCAIRNFKRP